MTPDDVEVGNPELREVTVKLVGGVPGMEKIPELVEHMGRWLLRYEPERAKQGAQWLWTTDERDEALKLPFAEMMKLLQTPIGIRPNDGKPDRPITAYHIQITRTTHEEVL